MAMISSPVQAPPQIPAPVLAPGVGVASAGSPFLLPERAQK